MLCCRDAEVSLLPAHRPFGFIERFDPHFTPNTTDMDGLRYTFRNQPTIGQWNLAQLASAMIAGGLLSQVAGPLSCSSDEVAEGVGGCANPTTPPSHHLPPSPHALGTSPGAKG